MSGETWQFVWWGFRGRWGLRMRGVPYPSEGPHRGCIYSGCYRIGPLELRRWARVRKGKSDG